MHDQIPEVRGATRLAREGMTLTAGDRQFSENVGVVDPNFLQVIPLPLVSGDPRTVLSRPENMVISQSAARKYFGDADPVGKTLTTGRGGCDRRRGVRQYHRDAQGGGRDARPAAQHPARVRLS